MSLRLAVVTASLDPEKTQEYWESWEYNAGTASSKGPNYGLYFVTPRGLGGIVETDGIVGVVPAFAAGVRKAAEDGADIIACFHDDLRIDEEGWDLKVLKLFEEKPRCGLAGFFGAKALGAGDIYSTPYNPMQLARGNCGSNMVEAEKHGERWTEVTRAVCFDGFSQIGRAKFMVEAFDRLEKLGVIHHAYDSALGAMAIRAGWECYFLPVACHHAGGSTAVGSAAYNEWAKKKDSEGDHGLWKQSHRLVYEELRGALPLWVSE